MSTFHTAAQSVSAATMAFVPTPSPTVVDQTTLMKKYLQFVAALTDTNTRKFTDFKARFYMSHLDRYKMSGTNGHLCVFIAPIIPNAGLVFKVFVIVCVSK